MGYTFLRFPGGKPKAVTFSYDDGPKSDLRLAETLGRYGCRGTFNLNSALLPEKAEGSRLCPAQIQAHILDRGHEVAVHGAFHRAPGKVRAIEGIRDVLDCRLQLEAIFGGIIRGMAYPDSGITEFTAGGSYQQVRAYLQDLGIAYARTLGGDNGNFALPADFYAWTPTAHHNNSKIFDWIDAFCAFPGNVQYHAGLAPRLFYVWGHSYEFDNQNNWDRLERICAGLGNRIDTWYATNIEICDYVNAYYALRWSADGKTVMNPALFDVHLLTDGKPVCIGAGKTVRLQ